MTDIHGLILRNCTINTHIRKSREPLSHLSHCFHELRGKSGEKAGIANTTLLEIRDSQNIYKNQ